MSSAVEPINGHVLFEGVEDGIKRVADKFAVGGVLRGIVRQTKQGVDESCTDVNDVAGKSERAVDSRLVERVKNGDKKAFDVLVLKYQHKVVKLISRYVFDQNEALDVAQEAFIKAYRAIPSFRGDSAFYTWLYRIAANTAKNHLVSQSRRPPAVDMDVSDAEQYEGQVHLRDLATPEECLITDEVEKAVLKALETLPDDLRTAITLRELDGLSYEEIARAMGCPVGTVRSRIFRAREAIGERLRRLRPDW